MSKYYNPQRTRSLFSKNFEGGFPISRTKLDLFLNCPRCFYLDRKLGVGQPPGYPFSLNSAVDKLLKKEFDAHRAAGTPHPLMEAFGVAAVPFPHPDLERWRDALRGGVRFYHEPTKFLITGGIDDVWVNGAGELYIVDYKATAKNGEVNLDADWQIGYKRQMEIYQWLFRKNGFAVNSTSYFVYCNGETDRAGLNSRLEFAIKIIPYEGNDTWIESTLGEAHRCLLSEKLPRPSPDCDFCRYRKAAMGAVKDLEVD